ncbi:hypothetical protein ABDD95_17475 [Mucilaginibacter sp. PAMB04274]|uniref:hypothetical protein n=1 Tax=Mucilaginibacter sp. PAMB04274 TaxID=3138568 RepID=UPI0031F6CFFB
MKNYYFLLALLLFKCMPAAAQERTNTMALSIGPELNIAQRSAYNIGYGVSAKFELPVLAKVNLVLTGAYNRFSYKSFLIGSAIKPGADSYIPLKGGFKYYLDPRFYTELELGTIIANNTSTNFNGSGNLFTYSLGTGFLIPVGSSKSNLLDLGLRYEDWSKNRLQQFAIRAAYRFGF